MNYDDTIVAIATALSPSGIGIIRVSGKESVKIVSSIFVSKSKKNILLNETHKVKYGYIYDYKKEEFVDEVLCIAMLNKKSYTAEDVVEIQCHGGMIVLKKILNLIEEQGARLAEPGEFTKRAFLNGRIDLIEAEAVSDIIMAKNEYAEKISFKALKGNISEKIDDIRKNILEKIAFIEACLDDPEHMSLDGYSTKIKENLLKIIEELNKIIYNYNNGRLIKEGINTVIIGRPNVGKSSLLNLLLDEERAIVTEIAGTTRDIISETINLNGITLNLIDTAGIREGIEVGEIEKIGIERTKNAIKKADLVLIVLDLTQDCENEEKKIFDICKENEKKYIVILNKEDISEEWREKGINNEIKGENPTILFSTKTKKGLEELKETIEQMFIKKEINIDEEVFITNERHLTLIKSAKKSLENVINTIDNKVSEEFMTIDLNSAYKSLSQVLGIEVTEDVIDEIFSKFCMGK